MLYADGAHGGLPGAVQGLRADVAAHGPLERHLLPHLRAAQAPLLNKGEGQANVR